MLQPGTRFDLMESLRPPPGMQLAAAVGTTYTLDLDALMGVSAAFATDRARAAVDADETGLEPVALLDAVRRTASRMAVFCQAGAVKVPARSRQVFAWLEDSVVECLAPGGGVFHPKVWVLRYVDADGGEALRFLCLSRNLTFDRSWDVVLRLDADLSGKALADEVGESGPRVARFLRSLLAPGVAVGRPSTSARGLVDQLARCAERATFHAPEGFTSVDVWPMGLGDPGPPLGTDKERVLVCAPFIGPTMLGRLAPAARPHVLISRAESIDQVGADGLASFEQVYVMSAEADVAEAEAENDVAETLRGLHAKFFVFEHRAKARLLIGSPNATTAAFDTNVEVACELRGHTRDAGIDAVLAHDSAEVSLLNLLTAYAPPEHAVPTDADHDLQFVLQKMAADVTAAAWRARVVEGEGLEVTVTSPVASLASGVSIKCRPITLRSHRAAPIDVSAALPVAFACTPEAVTAFIAVTLRVEAGGADGEALGETAFVVNAELVGAPADRKERVLATLLADPARFIEYLLLLLGQTDDAFGMDGGSGIWRGAQAALAGGGDAPPLLEVLLRAASRAPDSLEHVAALVDGLRQTPEGRAALPPGFEEVWDVVWAACSLEELP